MGAFAEGTGREDDRPRHVWIMVPAGEITETVIQELAEVLEPDDVIIDGGNSYYRTTSSKGAGRQGNPFR